MAELHDVNDAGFEEAVVRAALPVLVDFWGENCPSCRAISPILRDLAAEYAGRVQILKLHTELTRGSRGVAQRARSNQDQAVGELTERPYSDL